jgi:CheY-like chemotaxis protein
MTQTSGKGGRTGSPRALVVDDEWMSVADLCAKLRARGIEVDEARTRDEALDRLRDYSYQVVTLDLMLPESSVGDLRHDLPSPKHGISVLQAIREGAIPGASPQLPVFVVTGLGLEAKDVIEEVDRLGVAALFGKPVPAAVVAERIRLCLEGMET